MRTERTAIAAITMNKAIPEEFPRSLLAILLSSTARRNSTQRHLGPEVVDSVELKLRRAMDLDRDLDQVRIDILRVLLVAVPGVDEPVCEARLPLVLPPIAKLELLEPVKNRV